MHDRLLQVKPGPKAEGPRYRHYIGFTRRERLDLTTIAYVELRSDHAESQAAFDALCAAVTEWVDTSEDGVRLWEHSGEDLNIGDLLSEGVFEAPAFMACLRRHGIAQASAQGGGVDYEVDYDHVLCGSVDEAEVSHG